MQAGKKSPLWCCSFYTYLRTICWSGLCLQVQNTFNWNGPGKAMWRDHKAVVENTGIAFCSVMHQTLDILLRFSMHSLQGEIFRCLFLAVYGVNHSTAPQPSTESEADLTMDTHLNREVTGQLLFVCLNGTLLCYFFFRSSEAEQTLLFLCLYEVKKHTGTDFQIKKLLV